MLVFFGHVRNITAIIVNPFLNARALRMRRSPPAWPTVGSLFVEGLGPKIHRQSVKQSARPLIGWKQFINCSGNRAPNDGASLRAHWLTAVERISCFAANQIRTR